MDTPLGPAGHNTDVPALTGCIGFSLEHCLSRSSGPTVKAAPGALRGALDTPRPRKKIFVFQVIFLDFPGSHGWKKKFFREKSLSYLNHSIGKMDS